MKNIEIQDELDWAAFCYAAGELTPAEVERFEARLADEQPAREALARAVEMTQAVAAAQSQADSYAVAPAARQRPSWTTRLAWMAVGGTAAALAAVLWSGSLNKGGQAPLSGEQLLARSELASAWTQARDEIAAAKEAGQWPSIVTLADSYDEPGTESREGDLALEEAPSWMTAAVFGLAGVSPADLEGASPFNNERGEN